MSAEPLTHTGGAIAMMDDALLALRRLWTETPPTVHDLTVGHVDMSTILIVDALTRFPPEADVGVTDIAAALTIAPSTASRLLVRAERAGCVHRRGSSSDSRRVSIELSSSGEQLADTARRFRQAYLTEVTACWTAAERSDFARLLRRFALATQASPPAVPSGVASRPSGAAAAHPVQHKE